MKKLLTEDDKKILNKLDEDLKTVVENLPSIPDLYASDFLDEAWEYEEFGLGVARKLYALGSMNGFIDDLAQILMVENIDILLDKEMFEEDIDELTRQVDDLVREIEDSAEKDEYSHDDLITNIDNLNELICNFVESFKDELDVAEYFELDVKVDDEHSELMDEYLGTFNQLILKTNKFLFDMTNNLFEE